MTELKFIRKQGYLHYCIEIEHSDTTYPWLLNYTVEQTDSFSWVEFFSTDKGKHFEFVIQSLNGAKQIEFLANRKQFHFQFTFYI